MGHKDVGQSRAFEGLIRKERLDELLSPATLKLGLGFFPSSCNCHAATPGG